MKIEPVPSDKVQRPSFIISVRFLLAIMVFFGVALQYMQRTDMSIAIVAMVNSTAVKERDSLNQIPDINSNSFKDDPANDSCLFKPVSKNVTDTGSFVWSKSVQGLILSSYFYGYILTQILGGWLSIKYGAKIILGLSMLGGSIITVLVIPSASWGYGAVMACRFLIGVSHGMLWPAVSAIFVKWAPSIEKSRLIGFSASGSNIGNVIALPLGGFFCEFEGGWKTVFYVFGFSGVLWFILFILLTADSPRQHKFISEKEKNFIKAYTEDSYSNNESVNASKKSAIPWLSIFTSKPCIAIFVAHLCNNWGSYLFLTQLPSFMNDILRFDIKSNGLFSSIPYISCWLFVVISSYISDRLIISKKIQKHMIRKIFNCLGMFVPMIAVICLSFVTCSDPYMGVFLLAIGVGFLGCNSGAGFQVNINEIGGQFSGILFGVSNTFATISGIVAPYIVGVLTPEGTAQEWKIVFYITAGVYCFGGIFYTVFSKTNPEKWALPNNDS